ncbi:MAG: methyltransferase domain-containing protein [Ruminococcaceae bacterium]|nr:methyltransferase domain-containing protein [Oscillospiraceae bacterium]
MTYFLCPVCGKKLTEHEKGAVCPDGHSFDKAKSGYINLLPNNLPAGNHGDNKLMIRARHDFLEKGYYLPLRDNICEVIKEYAEVSPVIIDAGCGEGWYTKGIFDYIEDAEILAVDISKDAMKIAAKREKQIKCAAASVFHLPIEDECANICLSVFSPLCEAEFNRVLRKGGYFIYVIPAENHLWSLKKAVYDEPYKNEVKPYEMESFIFKEKFSVDGVLKMQSADDVRNLFMMTPYYYKTSQSDTEKLLASPPERIEYAFEILIFQKK